ncbi:MAG: MxaK protein [Steroidobacteraceae bacterium]
MRRRAVHSSFAIVAATCGTLAIWYGIRMHQTERINAAIATANISAADSTVPQAQLARALSLARAGQFTAALKTYKSLLDASDEIRLPALYDLGNLNMRAALKNGPGEAQRFMPLIELAKQSYRDDLRGNPEDWDARYNLERALWLSPEYDDPMLERNQAPVRSEHAMSTLQGAKIDLP